MYSEAPQTTGTVPVKVLPETLQVLVWRLQQFTTIWALLAVTVPIQGSPKAFVDTWAPLWVMVKESAPEPAPQPPKGGELQLPDQFPARLSTTVNWDVLLTEPDAAVMVVVPTANPVAMPQLPEALPILATPGDEELQVTEEFT